MICSGHTGQSRRWPLTSRLVFAELRLSPREAVSQAVRNYLKIRFEELSHTGIIENHVHPELVEGQFSVNPLSFEIAFKPRESFEGMELEERFFSCGNN